MTDTWQQRPQGDDGEARPAVDRWGLPPENPRDTWSAAPTGAPYDAPPPSGAPAYPAPAFGAPTSSPPAYGAAAYGAPRTAPLRGPSPARAAMPSFLLGTAVAIGVSLAGYAVENSRSGGILWFGGYFVALAFFRSAWAKYSLTSKLTGQKLSSGAVAVAGICAVAVVGSMIMFGSAYATAHTPRTVGIGSCFTQEGDRAFDVDCSDSSATYVAVAQAPSVDQCPQNAEAGVRQDSGAGVLCLARK